MATHDKVTIASINVQGCASKEKRDCIDLELKELNIEVCGIQEARCSWERLETENYAWHLSSVSTRTSHRGVGILIKKQTNVAIKNFKSISENMCSGWIEKGETGFTLIVCHIPSDKRMPDTFAELATVLSTLPPEDDYVLLGDFNGHLGTNDATEEFNQFLGKRLLHKDSNENGFFMLQLIAQFELQVCTTFARSGSVLETWHNRKSSTQIDHIMKPISSRLCLQEKNIYGVWPKLFRTDHKILVASIRKPSVHKKTPKAQKQRRKQWNAKLLKTDGYKEKFSETVRDAMKKLDDNKENPATRWTELKNIITDAACKVIPTAKKEPMSPKTKRAYSMLQRKLYRKKRFADMER